MTNRRSFLIGFGAALATPAIVRAEVLMPVRKLVQPKAINNAALFEGIAYPWVPCDGRALSRLVYADLFATIGETYGCGDGSTTFNLPDMRPSPVTMPGNGQRFALEEVMVASNLPYGALPAGAIFTRLTGAR